MDLRSCLDFTRGGRFNMVVDHQESIGNHHFGFEVPFGVHVAYHYEGSVEKRMTLYNVHWASSKMGEAWLVNLDSNFPPMMHKTVDLGDFSFAHDLCCGLGGFSTALKSVGMHPITAVDSSSLALSAFMLNHDVPSFHADVGCSDLVFKLHEQQCQKQCQPLICAGFPCQPLSIQGSQLGAADPRSGTLRALLRCAFWLQSAGLFLECVPEAMQDVSTQHSLRALASIMDFQLVQKVIHLHHTWPSRRNRWFAWLLPKHVNLGRLDDLPEISPAPVVHDLIPHTLWPLWASEDEAQLQWTEMECQAYRNPEFGPIDRRIKLDEPLPTALHSWGSALFACPCGCRQQGLSPFSLRLKGLRGIEVCSALWPHASRHIHPRELQLLMGFSPLEAILPDCRAQLCLQGNAVSPIQAIWVLAHLTSHLGLGTGLSPRESIRQHMIQIIDERNVTWPSPTAGDGTLILDFAGVKHQIAFTTTQTVGNLLRAEAALCGQAIKHELFCDGILLPSFAFLQERAYELVPAVGETIFPHECVPVFLVSLGEMQLYWTPASMTYGNLIAWVGIHEFSTLLDESSNIVQPSQPVEAWKQVIVQLEPDTVALDLDLYMQGFGDIADGLNLHNLVTSRSWICTGLWPFDQLVKSNLLMSWVGSGYRQVAVWLPSFAAAVLECWPCMIDDKLESWLRVPEATIHALVYEDWGWNMAKMTITPETFSVAYFDAPGFPSIVAAHLAFRAFQVSKRASFQEQRIFVEIGHDAFGTLHRVLQVFDLDLGIPPQLARILHGLSAQSSLDFEPLQPVVSPTLPWTLESDTAEGLVRRDSCGSSGHGLSAGFMLQLVQAFFPESKAMDFEVKVWVGSQHAVHQPGLQLANIQISSKPIFALVLLEHHWVLVCCDQDGPQLRVQVYDGLDSLTFNHLRCITSKLQQAWGTPHISYERKWIIQQNMQHTCGTVALGHLLLVAKIISYEQAMHFEKLHEGFIHCDPFQSNPALIGYGQDDPIVEALAQILPSKGVPPDEVPNRAQAAIKAFGRGPVQRALQASNVWASLKQLGNSRPKPFMWVTHDELQTHIKDRASTKFGVELDIKRQRKQKHQRPQPASHQIDPTNLVLPAGFFTTNCGTPLGQLPLSGVVKNARGIAFATASDALQYATEGKLISTEGLAMLIVGPIPEAFPQSLPMHGIRVPAMYKATNEPVLLDCTSMQLGDQAVYQQINAAAPEVQVFPSVVFRVHAFRDTWEIEGSWPDFVDHPVRSILGVFPTLRLCKDPQCQGLCPLFHPSIEETGIESGLLDVWGFKWAKLDGSKAAPLQAAVLSVYLRVPESNFEVLHVASGQSGIFFEPRQKDQPAPDPRFAVVWVPQASFQDLVHRVKTLDDCLAVCRLGAKLGIRCFSKHHEALHALLVPNRPYIQCAVKQIYRLEPLPAGTQRQSLVDTLKSFGWTAKPLHPCPGSQGKAWLVGTEHDPPMPFLEAQHGWVSVSKVRDQVTQPRPQDLIATAKTKQHIKEQSTAAASSNADPWHTGSDPWSGYQSVSKPAAASTPGPTQHVQQKFDEVEQKLQEHVQHTLETHIQKADNETTSRLHNVEGQIQSLVEHQHKMQQWIQDGSSKIHDLRQDYSQLQATLQSCTAQSRDNATAIAGVVNDLGTCNNNIVQQGQALQVVAQDLSGLKDNLSQTLESYFDRQAEKIESLLAKRQRHD